MNIVLGGLVEPLLVTGGLGGAPLTVPDLVFVDPDAGTLIVADDPTLIEIDPDAGTVLTP